MSLQWHDLAVISSIAAWMSMVLVVIKNRGVHLGFAAVLFITLAIVSNSGAVLGWLMGDPLVWMDQACAEASVMHAMGLISFSIGVLLAGTVVRKPRGQWNPLPALSEKILVIIFLLGTAATTLQSWLWPIPTLNAITSQMELGASMALICLFYQNKKGNLKWGLLGIWLIISVLQMMRSGHIGIVNALVQLVMVGIIGRNIGWKKIVLLCVAGIMVTQILFSWFSVRNAMRNDQILAGLSWSQKIPAFFSHIKWATFDREGALEIYKNIWMTRFDNSATYGQQYAWMPQHEPFVGMGTVFPAIFAAIIPRALWPEKSITQGGTEFVNRFTGQDWDPKHVQFNMPFPFECYAMFGIIGVIGGMLLIGFLLSCLERYICFRYVSLPVLLAMLVSAQIISRGGDPIQLCVMALISGISLYLVIGLILHCGLERSSRAMTTKGLLYE